MKLVKAMTTVAGFSLLSRLTGMVRDIMMAAAIGRGPLADAFFVALKLPNMFRRIAAEGRVVLTVLHDLALAARWSDRIAILHKGSLYAFGPPAEVVTPAMLAEVYGVEARVERCSRGHLMVQIDGEITR